MDSNNNHGRHASSAAVPASPPCPLTLAPAAAAADLATQARRFAAAFNATCDAEGIPVSRAARKRVLAVLPGGRA